MKLLELFTKSFNHTDIPSHATYIMQDRDGEVKYTDSHVKPVFGGYAWIRNEDLDGDNFGIFPATEDASTSVITREELMRAYDLVEQGYTLWFGGECPVQAKDRVEVIWRDGGCILTESKGEDYSWFHFNEGDDIIAYKVLEQLLPKEKLSLPTYYCEEKLQDTALDVWTSRSGDLCVNLTSVGVNNEIVMNPIVALQFANDLSVLALKIMENRND